MFKLVSVILRGMRESKRDKKERDLREKECISLLSFKRISWCGSRGAGETEKNQGEQSEGKTKAQLLFHRLQEKGQLSALSVPLRAQ